MRSIFSFNYLDASILPTGFIDWNPARYSNWTTQAEYRDYGPGFNVTGRKEAMFDVQLSEKQFERYSTPAKVFQDPEGRFGNVGWIDWSV